MAKKKNQKEEIIVDVQELYSKTEHFIEDNKKTLTITLIAITVVIGGYFAYKGMYLAPLQAEADQQMFRAEKYFAQDSLNLAIHGDDTHMGFLEIADRYSSTKAGNLSNYYLGISFLRTGQYELAITALQNFKGKGTVLEGIAIGAIGDAYMELGDVKKAVANYKKASRTEANEFSSPIYIMKMGNSYELMGDYKSAIKAYYQIKEEYQDSPQAREIDKYIARAESFID